MMKNSVQMNIRNQRSKLLRSLSEKKKRIFYNSQLNKTKSILFESENKFGYIHGFTDNYIKVRHPWDPKLSNRLVDAKLLAIDDEGYMRIAKVQESSKNDIKLSYSDSNW
jgi:threonylcarbamoyladenosine tRNA methylthiotransferase MtaB